MGGLFRAAHVPVPDPPPRPHQAPPADPHIANANPAPLPKQVSAKAIAALALSITVIAAASWATLVSKPSPLPPVYQPTPKPTVVADNPAPPPKTDTKPNPATDLIERIEADRAQIEALFVSLTKPPIKESNPLPKTADPTPPPAEPANTPAPEVNDVETIRRVRPWTRASLPPSPTLPATTTYATRSNCHAELDGQDPTWFCMPYIHPVTATTFYSTSPHITLELLPLASILIDGRLHYGSHFLCQSQTRLSPAWTNTAFECRPRLVSVPGQTEPLTLPLFLAVVASSAAETLHYRPPPSPRVNASSPPVIPPYPPRSGWATETRSPSPQVADWTDFYARPRIPPPVPNWSRSYARPPTPPPSRADTNTRPRYTCYANSFLRWCTWN